MSDFLARHNGDPNQQILPDELLPLDTKATSVSPRRRSSSTHTLVIPTHQHYTVHSCNGHTHHASSTTTPSTPSALSRFINSTPPSRRGSVCNSPEPLSSSSGYNSMVTTSGRQSQLSNGSTTPSTKIPIFRRRRLSSINDASLNIAGDGTRFGFGGLSRSTSSSILSGDMNHGSSIPRSATGSNLKLARYPNYLNSSQHITGRMMPATSSSSTSGDFSGASTPTTPVTAKYTSAMQLRKTSQKTF